MSKTKIRDFLPTENDELSDFLSDPNTKNARIIPVSCSIQLHPRAVSDPMEPARVAMGRKSPSYDESGGRIEYTVTWLKVVYDS